MIELPWNSSHLKYFLLFGLSPKVFLSHFFIDFCFHRSMWKWQHTNTNNHKKKRQPHTHKKKTTRKRNEEIRNTGKRPDRIYWTNIFPKRFSGLISEITAKLYKARGISRPIHEFVVLTQLRVLFLQKNYTIKRSSFIFHIFWNIHILIFLNISIINFNTKLVTFNM